MTDRTDRILNEVIKDVKKDLKDNQIDDAFADLTDNFIRLYVEGLQKEKEKTEYWKQKAYILFQNSNIGRLECPEHDTHIERSFDPWEAIKDKECKTCKAQEKEGVHSELSQIINN